MCGCNQGEHIVRGFLTYFILHGLIHVVSALPIIQLFLPFIDVGILDVAAQTVYMNIVTHVMLIIFVVYRERNEIEKRTITCKRI